MNPLFLNTILLGGTTTDKLRAASAAGFAQVELWRQDVEAFGGTPDGLKDELATRTLGLTDYQVLLDFDGAPAAKREAKRREALAMLDTASRVGATTLLVPASTDAACDGARVIEDMAWLAQAAAAGGLRIAYEGMAWSTLHPTLPAAWDVVRRVDAPNLGLVVDAFHMFVRGRTADDLDGIPAGAIYLVQLSDLDHAVGPDTLIETARHHRLLPGRGRFPLRGLLDRLKHIGYGGPIGLEVFNDDLKARDPMVTAVEAMAALRRVLSE
ncbi:MAG: sugar phosphate isomerase/epimerase [Azospirillaceae bacterium]|nr:sugar phosphate isomerase/epimerase [Azospirillaceae bacterium]